MLNGRHNRATVLLMLSSFSFLFEDDVYNLAPCKSGRRLKLSKSKAAEAAVFIEFI